MTNIKSLNIFVIFGILISLPAMAAGQITDPLQYSAEKAKAYSDSIGNEGIEIECKPLSEGKNLSVSCQSEIYRWDDWGPNGPVWFDRKDNCKFSFAHEGDGYAIISEACDTENVVD